MFRMKDFEIMNILLFFAQTVHMALLTSTAGSLSISITDIRSDDGHVLLSIHNQGAGFPMSEEGIIKELKIAIKNGQAKVRVDDLPVGEYAIALIHDENDNGKLDTNFLGIPKEGTAASNDAKGFMGPPKYEDAKFNLGAEGLEMSIRMTYF